MPTAESLMFVRDEDAIVAHGFALEAVAEATTLSTRLAVVLGEGEAMLRALTGRGELPPKFTVLST